MVFSVHCFPPRAVAGGSSAGGSSKSSGRITTAVTDADAIPLALALSADTTSTHLHVGVARIERMPALAVGLTSLLGNDADSS